MTLGDLVGVCVFPAVVQAADIRILRKAENFEAARDFIRGYLGFDERSRRALTTSLVSLAQAQRGGAFFLNGVFGSGKSHLLGLLALLADGIGHEVFSVTHPQLAELLSDPISRFVVHFSLDDYNPARLSLEEIVHLEIAHQWQHHFEEKLEISHADLRREYFAALDEQLLTRGFQGFVLCIDELSLFLSAKEHPALQADAAFLQFIGQKAMRHSACPMHLFAAIQKTIDDIGDIEAYSLSQIRDRFQTLPLSLAHLPSLIALRLIVHKNPIHLQDICRESYAALCKALPRLDFAQSEWETLFPFHPTTIKLLEKIVTRFFSRTRSAAIFCANAAEEVLGAPIGTRVLPEKLFDYFLPELETHPDLHPLFNVWKRWEEAAAELSHDTGETQTLRCLMKTLLLFKIAGTAPTAVQLANAMALDAQLPDDGNYKYTRVLLERILARGSHLAVERHDTLQEKELFNDRYTVDLGTRVSELARRRLRNSLSQLRPEDARIAASVLACCRDESLPLSTLLAERVFPIYWKHSARAIAVQLLQSPPSSELLTNRLAMLEASSERAELLLFILAPFSSHQTDPQPKTLLQNPRYLIWSPRLPTADELQSAREATAADLLELDPQLLDNRQGRAIVQFLKDARPTREAQRTHLAQRLLREGVFRFGDGRVLEASELALGNQWQSTLEAVGDLAFPQVFPRFKNVAPLARTLTASNAQQLCLELLRRPAEDPYFPVSLERLVRTLAQPLGVAQPEKGRWKISAPHAELTKDIKTQIGDGTALRSLESYFLQSDWGLKEEQLALALCALLRNGELTASSSQGQVLAPEKIGFPLNRGIHQLNLGVLLDREDWERLQSLIALLTEEELSALSFTEQLRAREILASKRDELEAESELLQARLRQLQRTLNHSPSEWPRAESTLQQMSSFLETLPASSEAYLFLQKASLLDTRALAPLFTHWKELQELFELRLAELLELHRLLKHPRLSAPPPLQSKRSELLQRLEMGEAVLEDEEFFTNARHWRSEYFTAYREFHSMQHNPTRWNSLRRLQNSDALQALERLSTLRSRAFGPTREIQNELQTEMAKQCPRDGTLLPGEATCNACDLRFGERIQLSDAKAIEATLASEITLFHRQLQEEDLRRYLQRNAKSTLLLDWDGQSELLAPLLDDHTLFLLEEAFKPRRKISRKIQDLTSQLSQCRTRAEMESAFQAWLDADDRPESDDEIALQ